MSQPTDTMELRESEIRAQYDAAFALLQGFEYSPKLAREEEAVAPSPGAAAVGRAGFSPTSGLAARRRFRSTTPGLATREHSRGPRAHSVHLRERVEAGDDGDPLPSALQAQILRALRRALAIGLAMGEGFGRQSGLAALKAGNLSGRLPSTERARFAALLEAEALVVLYSFANALTFLLSQHQGQEVVEVGDVREILTENAPLALHGALWEVDRALSQTTPKSPERGLAALLAVCEQVMDMMALRAQNKPELAAFGAHGWHVAADDLTLHGFTPSTRARGKALAMAFREPHEVVGNHIAKHQALRLARMLMAYDFERKLNPFAELGGFIFTFMGDGKPGTGKTTLIQMMAGLVHGYCETAGYPFHYQNLSTESIDSYQGKSAQNAKAFVRAVMDPGVIGFGTIDDIDQLAGKRGDRQSSAGQLEITAVLMESFAGANTVVRGNCTFGMFSNYPENVDDALRQRAGARFLVDGPQTREDYVDILHLLLGSHHDIPLGDHEAFAAQEIKRAVSASYARHERPQEEALAEVFDRVCEGQGELASIAQLGTYLKAIQEADERFTGRAIKNITDAVKVRAMDFDLPDEWVEEPDVFLFQPYETKLAMITELRKPITAQMVLQEINRYADSEFRYADQSDEAAIAAAVREMERMGAARARFRAENEV